MTQRVTGFGFLIMVIQFGGCPQPADSGRGVPAGPVVVGNGTFSVTLPGSAREISTDITIPGATFQAVHEDEVGGLYVIFAMSPESGFGSTSTDDGSRFDGTMQTSAGDYGVLSMTPSPSGTQVCALLCQLADGGLLYVGTDCANPLRPIVFGSVDLFGTDGSGIDSLARTDAPFLLSPVREEVVLLGDNLAYRVTSPSDLHQLTKWSVGDAILAYEAPPDIFSTGDFFLVRVGDWRSIPADFIGVANRAALVAVVDPEIGAAVVQLGNGTGWEVAYSDEALVKLWRTGDEIAVVRDAGSFLGFTLLRLQTGETAVAKPK